MRPHTAAAIFIRLRRTADLKALSFCGIGLHFSPQNSLVPQIYFLSSLWPLCSLWLTTKKAAVPEQGTAALISKTKTLQTYSVSVGVPYARTLNKILLTGRFSDLRLPKEPFPLISEQWYCFFRSPGLSGKNAYSGATVTASNRVPFSVINYFFLKELS